MWLAIGLVCVTLRGQTASPASEANVDALVKEQIDLAEKGPDRDTCLVLCRYSING
jgi:hypothetical protein